MVVNPRLQPRAKMANDVGALALTLHSFILCIGCPLEVSTAQGLKPQSNYQYPTPSLKAGVNFSSYPIPSLKAGVNFSSYPTPSLKSGVNFSSYPTPSLKAGVNFTIQPPA